MSNPKILINQTVAILCDGNNIERSIHEQSGNTNTMVNFDTLIPRLLNGRGLNRLIYFREGQNISYKLAERLHTNYYGSVVACHKTADIPLSIKATQLASKVDTIIIMSGDSDFIDLVKHLKAEGVRVEIAAVEKTTSRHLKEEVDYFHPITKNDWFSYTSKWTPRRDFRKDNNSEKKDVKIETKVEEKKEIKIPEVKVEKAPEMPKLESSETKTPVKKAVEAKKPVVKKTTTTKKAEVKKAEPKKTVAKKTTKTKSTAAKKSTSPPKMKGATKKE